MITNHTSGDGRTAFLNVNHTSEPIEDSTCHSHACQLTVAPPTTVKRNALPFALKINHSLSHDLLIIGINTAKRNGLAQKIDIPIALAGIRPRCHNHHIAIDTPVNPSLDRGIL
jgi:hypothetical protein